MKNPLLGVFHTSTYYDDLKITFIESRRNQRDNGKGNLLKKQERMNNFGKSTRPIK